MSPEAPFPRCLVRSASEVRNATHQAWRTEKYAYRRHTVLMSAMRGVVRRPDDVPTVLLQGRVSPQVRAEVRAAAQASGVSIAYYLEALFEGMLRDQGSLPLVDRPLSRNEELPIPAA